MLSAVTLKLGRFYHVMAYVAVIVVVIQFLSDVVPLADMAGFTPFLLQLLALHLFTLLDSGHHPSNQSVSPLSDFLRSFPLSFATHFKMQSNPQTLSSSLLSTCPYHLPPFAVANWSIVFINPACPSVLSSSFCQQLSDRTWLSPKLSPFSLTLLLPRK